jgi:hypothetical protein
MKNIRIKSGRYFPKPFIYLAYAMIIFGVFLSFENILGIAIIVIALFLAFAPQIIEIKADEKLYRNSLSIFGLSLGNWQSYKDFPYISLIKNDIIETTYGGRTNRSVSTKNRYYFLCLLTRNHRLKIVLNSYKDKSQAIKELEKYSEILELEKVRYSPQFPKKNS